MMQKLAQIFDGWNGYHESLLRAVVPLTKEQLAFKAGQDMRSMGQLIRHIALGRITWLARIEPLGIDEAVARVLRWFTDGDGNRHVDEEAVSCGDSQVLAEWLAASWSPIERSLDSWTVDDLLRSYPYRFRGTDYLISRQWVLWRILSHDIHHGGQLALLLAMQGVPAFELRALGGHLTEPPLLQSN
jgi:uncharacterized damage-inducible protein DinB